MKTFRGTSYTLYANWVNATWPILTGWPHPSSTIAKAAQVAADQQWEGEGGRSAKPVEG